MKTLFRILSLSLGLASVYLVLTSKTGQDVVLAVACLAMAIVSACFMIMEEQREEINKLRKGINAYHKSMEHTGRRSMDDNTVMDTYKDWKGRRWFKITETEKF